MQRRITLSLTWKVFMTSLLVIFIFMIGISYGGYRLYTKVIATEAAQRAILENQNKERVAQEEKSHELILVQQKALDEATSELTKTKSEAKETNEKVKTLTKAVEEQSKAPKEIILSSSDLTPYATGVVQVICSTPGGISSGSGTLWNFKEIAYGVVTNYHVVKDAEKCVISITNSSNGTTGMFSIKGSIYTFNQNTDEAILTIGTSVSSTSVPISNYNYGLAKVRTCPALMPVGTPVVIIGFPAYAKRDSVLAIDTIGSVNVIYRTTTNGIISGYDTSQKGEANYFVSAKIDNGNSGGMALAKDAKGICVLGLPTWLTVGNYETQGLVQNILNILPTSK